MDVDEGCLMIRMGVSGWMLLLVSANPCSPAQRGVKRLCVSICTMEKRVCLIGSPAFIYASFVC